MISPQPDFYSKWGKRAFDLALSLVALLLLSPLLLLCALLVELTSRGPVFFRQVRLGQHGRLFRVFKFRTMRVGADRLGAAVVVPGDQRLTAIGNFLRRTKLDELPQLINVLLGDMSLVGPRPRVPEEVDVERAEERALLGLRPGITSYASIYHRMEAAYCAQHDDPGRTYRETVLPQKSFLDGEYLKNLSFSLDLKLILLTALLVFVPGKGEPATLRFFGLEIRPYSRPAKMAVEALLYAIAVWLAYWLRFEGALSDFYRFQLLAFVVLLPALRVGANALFGVYNMIWRYVNLVDASILILSSSLVSALLVALRLLLPSENSIAHIFQVPLGVIAAEFLLALGGALGVRALRRVLYEMDHRYQPLPVDQRRRILIVGGGLSGLGIALEIGRYPHLQLVGFVDDDPAKQGRVIAGYSVLGASEKLAAVIREQQVSDVIVCAGSMSAEALRRIQQECCTQRIKVHVIPTLAQILSAETPESLQAGAQK